MSNLTLLKSEIKALFKSKILLPMVLLNVVIMAWGVNSITNSNDLYLWGIRNTSLTISLGSARYGAIAGALIFASLIVFTLSKDKRKSSKTIIASSIDYSKLTIIRILSLIFYEIITIVVGMLIVLSIQIFLFKIQVDFSAYAYCYGVILFPAILFSIFLSSGLYMMTESMDITLLCIIVLFFLSLIPPHYLMAWVQTTVPVFSDFGGMEPVGKLIIYNRLLWTFISITVLLSGFLCRRSYEQTLLKSLKSNINNKLLTSLLIVFFFCSLFTWIKEPYINSVNWLLAEKTNINENIKLSKLNPEVIIDSENESMAAHVLYEFENNKSNYIDFSINEGLKIKDLYVNDKKPDYKRIKGTNLIEVSIPEDKNITIDISYEGKIKYDSFSSFAGYICKDSVYLLECSNWIFKPQTSQKDTVNIYGSISAPEYLTVVVPGKLIDTTSEKEDKKWTFELNSFNTDLGVFAAKYKKSELKVGNTNIEFYYSPKHENYINEKNIEAHIKNMMTFYSENIGNYYTNDHPLKIVETSIYKPGGHSSSNVITFAEYMVNREVQKGDLALMEDLGVIAHEMAHQWWGTAVNCVSETPWTNEGITNYSSYKYIDSEFGENSSDSITSRSHSYFNRVNNGYFVRNPESMKNLNEKYRKSIEMEYKQMQAYHGMPLMLKEGEKLQGKDVFMKNLSKVYKKYFLKDLTYDDFLKEMGLSKEEISIE